MLKQVVHYLTNLSNAFDSSKLNSKYNEFEIIFFFSMSAFWIKSLLGLHDFIKFQPTYNVGKFLSNRSYSIRSLI